MRSEPQGTAIRLQSLQATVYDDRTHLVVEVRARVTGRLQEADGAFVQAEQGVVHLQTASQHALSHTGSAATP